MTYLPYPNATRALRQLGRHDDETPPLSEPRPVTPFEHALIDGAKAAVRAASPVLAAFVAELRAARPGVVGDAP